MLMKQKILLALILIFSINAFSQDSKFNLEANYPIPIDNNFIGRSFKGIIDLGIKYRFSNLELLNIGVSLNTGVLKNIKSDKVQPFDFTMLVIQPRLFAELNSESLSKFHPSIGIGYTIINANATNTDSFNTQNKSSETQSGLNLNLGLAFDVSDKLFTQIQYDFVKIKVDNNIPDIEYNTNANILKIGLGYRL